MKKVFFLFGLISFLISCKHKRDEKIVKYQQVFCENDSILNDRLIGICDTTFLKSGSLLYYQFNCDSIWLTLESPKGEKNIIELDTTKEILYIYARLRHKLLKEYKDKLLFEYGCTASGGLCGYKLIDSKTGNQLKDFTSLIYFDEKSDFFIDLNVNTDSISVILPDSNRSVTVFNKTNYPIYPSIPDVFFTFEKKVKSKIFLTYYDFVHYQYPKYPDGRDMYFIIDLQNKTSEIRPKN